MSDKKNEEEVDLGSLFLIIGKGITELISGIKSIFLLLFDFCIQILLFIRNNIIKIGLGIFIGGVIGYGFESFLTPKFEADLQVQPNFNSSRQLYNNIEFYNDLVAQKDSVSLATLFKISLNEASSLKSFTMNPVIKESDIFNAYNKILKGTDSIKSSNFSYKNFKEGFTKYDYNIHKIIVVSTKNNVFKSLTSPIVSSVTENKHYKRIKELMDENLTRSEGLIKQNLINADSLQNTYQKVLLLKAKNNNEGTHINMSSQVNNKELELFNTNRLLNEDLNKIAKQRYEKSEVINIISNFQPIGHKIGSKTIKNKTFRLGVLGCFFVVIGLLFMKLNAYLKKYSR